MGKQLIKLIMKKTRETKNCTLTKPSLLTYPRRKASLNNCNSECNSTIVTEK